ncbi:MAG TPA: hemerythrin domain-containing protein, partial [Nitrospiraceae bacterium]|nr:hemerythrin domain-containing protein [Nitrospiraceae bacterium]
MNPVALQVNKEVDHINQTNHHPQGDGWRFGHQIYIMARGIHDWSRLMGEPETGKAGMLTEFLVEDHRRLDGFLQTAMAHPGTVDDQAYGQFRGGLLRHIGMEEKILLPAAQRQRSGEPLSLAAKLRLDHGALASLLMPTPTAAILATIQGILVEHNVLEEGPGGLYETCDSSAGPEGETILAALRAAPEVAVMRYNDSP